MTRQRCTAKHGDGPTTKVRATDQGKPMSLQPTTPETREKVIFRMQKSVRVGAAPHFAELAVEFKFHQNTIRKIYKHFIEGLPWGRQTDPRLEPRRVAHQVEQLRAAEPGLSDRACAKRLEINKGAFGRTMQEIKEFQDHEIEFPRENPNFLTKFLHHIRLEQKELRVTMYSLSHVSVTGALIAKHNEGVVVRVLLDQLMVLHPHSHPRIRELLQAGVPLFFQKGVSRRQCQEVIVVDDIAVSSGSVTGSTPIVYSYAERIVAGFTNEFELELAEDNVPLTQQWLNDHTPKRPEEETQP